MDAVPNQARDRSARHRRAGGGRAAGRSGPGGPAGLALRREPEVCAAWGGGEGYSWRSPWSKAREPNKLCGYLQAGDASRTKCALQISEPGFRPVVKTYVRETDVQIHFSHRREAHSRAQGEKGGDAEDGDGPATLIGTNCLATLHRSVSSAALPSVVTRSGRLHRTGR